MPEANPLYRFLDRELPSEVNRFGAEQNLAAGEQDYAITSLLDSAYAAGKLTNELLDLVEAKCGGGPVEEMVVALRMLMD